MRFCCSVLDVASLFCAIFLEAFVLAPYRYYSCLLLGVQKTVELSLKKNNDLNATRKTLPISGFVRKKCLLQFFPDEPGYTGSENVWKIIVCRTPLPDKVLS